MTYFTISEIFLSILYAFAFGAAYELILISALVLKQQLLLLGELPSAIFKYKGKLLSVKEYFTAKEKYENRKSSKIATEIYTFIKVAVFSFLFLFLSYYALDGEVRLYMLVCSIISMNVVKYLLTSTFIPVSERFFKAVLCGIIIFLRIVFFPIRKIFFFIWRKIYKNAKKKA